MYVDLPASSCVLEFPYAKLPSNLRASLSSSFKGLLPTLARKQRTTMFAGTNIGDV